MLNFLDRFKNIYCYGIWLNLNDLVTWIWIIWRYGSTYLIGNGVYTLDSAISPSLSRLDLHWVGVCFYIIFFNPNPFIHQLQQKFVQSVYHPIANKLSSHDFHFLKDWNYTVIIKGELTMDFGIIRKVLHKLEHELIDPKKKRLNCVI